MADIAIHDSMNDSAQLGRQQNQQLVRLVERAQAKATVS